MGRRCGVGPQLPEIGVRSGNIADSADAAWFGTPAI
jgi:hypothetical protein